jgi:hypothetical protein
MLLLRILFAIEKQTEWLKEDYEIENIGEEN